MDMVDIAKLNDGVKYVLVAIDIFSRFAHCRQIKSKKGEDVLGALKLILCIYAHSNKVSSMCHNYIHVTKCVHLTPIKIGRKHIIMFYTQSKSVSPLKFKLEIKERVL